MAGSSIRVTGLEQLTAWKRALHRAADPSTGLGHELQTELDDAAKATAKAVERAALTLPGRGDPVLRRQIADAVDTRTKANGRQLGTEIVVRRNKLPPGKGGLPAAMNRGHWQHPVFDTDRTVTQRSERGWFDNTIRRDRERFRKALRKAIRTTIKKIERST